jgi:hypothetical protein
VSKRDGSRIRAAGKIFMRKRVGCIGLDYTTHLDITKELNTQPTMGYI